MTPGFDRRLSLDGFAVQCSTKRKILFWRTINELQNIFRAAPVPPENVSKPALKYLK